MRVVVHVGGADVRGSERQVAILLRGLVARGHEVTASVRPGTAADRALAEAGARLTATRPRGDLDLVSLARFAAWLRRTRPDALLATSWKRAAAVLAAGRLAGVPRIVLRVGGPHEHRGGVGDRARAHAMAHWMDAAYANSAALREQLLAYAPALRPERVVVIPNALEPASAAPAPLREQLGLARDTPLLIAVGGLERNKGFDVLIRALGVAARADAQLAVVGAGPEHQPLVRLAETLGVAGRVHFLGHRRDVPALLRAADVFVLASRSDSTPNALLEAMDAELPVVTSATPGAAELLGPRADRPAGGWVVPVDDSAALAGALDEALGPAAPARAREAAQRVRAEHAPERTVSLVEALLDPSGGRVSAEAKPAPHPRRGAPSGR
jgi:glycosyltransferase involved in cell wall biosynthesis